MLIQPYLSVQRGNVRVPNLTVINGILFVTENGCKWRTLHLRFGKWYSGLRLNAALGRRRRAWPFV